MTRQNTRTGKALAKGEQEAFLEQYAIYGIVTTACEMTGVDRRKVYRWKESDEAFAERFKEAEVKANELLLQEARRRAIEGVPRYVIQKGKVVNYKGKPIIQNEYSDRLLELLLKGKMPETFRDRVDNTISGPNGETFQIVIGDPDFKVPGIGHEVGAEGTE